MVPAITDHLLVPFGCTRKQFSRPPFQVLQKPSWESRQVPSPLLPLPMGSRVILLSDVKTILNLLLPFVVAAVNGCPLKKVVSMSFGASRPAGAAAASARPGARTQEMT